MEALLFAGLLGDRSLPYEAEEGDLAQAVFGDWQKFAVLELRQDGGTSQ